MPGRRRRATAGRSTTTTSRRTTKAAPSRTTKKPAPDLPTAGPGERVWVLAVPFRAPAPGAVWRADLQAHVWVGADLPPELAPYDPPPYSFERFLEDELNDKPRVLPLARPMTPRDPQCDGADVVAAHAAAGGRVFLLGDDPGVGKTGTAILAVKAIAEQRDVRTVLVVADRPAAITIPHWTRSIAGFGDGDLRWCVTTWDRLVKVSKLAFDVIVADEAHMVRHTTTQRWKHWKAVSGAGRVKDAPFVLAATATPAHTPLELPYLAPEFAVRHGEPLRDWGDLPKKLAAHGFHVERGRYGWQWTEDADERRADLTRLQNWLAEADPPATLHRPAPWGPVSVTGTPVALTPAERTAYESEWSEFRAEMQ
ncbi:MAG TPA: helicase, partial [Blastococcus sp.]